jgi:septal ring factor EnvC (AmiA/AmiB activator)
MEGAGRQMLRREAVIDNLEARLAPERLEQLQKMRQDGLESGKKLLEAVGSENISPEVFSDLQAVRQKMDERLAETKKFLTEKKELLEKAQGGDDSAKKELQILRQERLKNIEENKALLKEKTEVRKELGEEIRGVKKNLREQAKDGDEQAREDLKKINEAQKENRQGRVERAEERKELRGNLKEWLQNNRQEMPNRGEN